MASCCYGPCAPFFLMTTRGLHALPQSHITCITAELSSAILGKEGPQVYHVRYGVMASKVVITKIMRPLI
jgi:hypothetical protein